MRWSAVFVVAGLAAGCASLPSLDGRTPTRALTGVDTRLGRALHPVVTARAGLTGIHPLPNPRNAFAARMVLAGVAERSIDVQYYIWRGDTTGRLLFDALWRAAERGVRVRMLLDDINTAGLDPTIAALDAHPNIEVRLYNPLGERRFRSLNFIGDFTRVNRRMHNKSFTVDNQVTIVGGRNIGNEYFGAGGDATFVDLDVAAVGAVVPAVSQQFDLYWNSPSAYPSEGLVARSEPLDLAAASAAARSDPAARAYIDEVRSTSLVADVLAGRLAFDWSRVRVVNDDPAKTLDTADRTEFLMFPQLIRTMGSPQRSFALITPYFVPGDQGTAALAAMAERGVAVRILTNSLAASDVSAVHAGYAKRRAALLRAGVRLFELKPGGAQQPDGSISSSSSSGLHAKTFAVDGAHVFVGSFNFDPRSARLNTEMGLVIASAPLANRLAAVFDEAIPRAAYEVLLNADGRVHWIEQTGAGPLRHDTEPGTGWFERLKVELLSVLPIDWLL